MCLILTWQNKLAAPRENKAVFCKDVLYYCNSVVIMSSSVCIAWAGSVWHDTCQTSLLLFLHKPDLCISTVFSRIGCWEVNRIPGGVLPGTHGKQDYIYEHWFKWLARTHAYALWNMHLISPPRAVPPLLHPVGFMDCNLRYCFVFEPDLSSRRWADWI